MYHCTFEDKPTVVTALNTGILILIEYVFASRLPDHDWSLQTTTTTTTTKKQFLNVSKIHDYTGNAVAITLPAMFFLTSCDTMSYFYCMYKKAIFEHVLKQEILSAELLSDLSEHTHHLETLEDENICPNICLWYVCFNVCSNLLLLTV